MEASHFSSRGCDFFGYVSGHSRATITRLFHERSLSASSTYCTDWRSAAPHNVSVP